MPETTDLSPQAGFQKEKEQMEPVKLQWSRGQGTVESVEGAFIDIGDRNILMVTRSIETIGMGRFQWKLAFSSGFGFLVDQMLLVSISLVGPQAAYEFGPRYETLISASLYAGMLIGALIAGYLADAIGRRMVWLLSLFGISVFTLISAGSPSWTALNIFVALSSLFGGGNLAIDLTLLSETLPARWAFVLTGLATTWGLGNAITGLIAWPLLVNYGCPSNSTPENCPKEANMGWRYLYLTLGALCFLMAILRAVVLAGHESPKWLVAKGRISEAVDVLNSISTMNGSDHRVTTSDFTSVDNVETKNWRQSYEKILCLYQGPRQTRLMWCLTLIWILVGIVYPLYTIFLPYYLEAHGADLGDGSAYVTYRDWAVSSVVGIFGPLLSMWMVTVRWFRSRRSMSAMAFICAVFCAAFTLVRTEAQNLAFSSMINFWLNALYGIVYSYTPQAINTENRGFGCGLLMAFGRLASLTAPFIATFSDVTSSVPIWVCCGLYVTLGVVAFILPSDTMISELGSGLSA